MSQILYNIFKYRIIEDEVIPTNNSFIIVMKPQN